MLPIKYIIHFERGQWCRCFSDRDLYTNIRFAVKQRMKIVRVEAVAEELPKAA